MLMLLYPIRGRMVITVLLRMKMDMKDMAVMTVLSRMKMDMVPMGTALRMTALLPMRGVMSVLRYPMFLMICQQMTPGHRLTIARHILTCLSPGTAPGALYLETCVT